jgi:hypothetical protein
MRYGLRGDGSGLHAIWGLSDPTAMAALSLTAVGAFALLLMALRSVSSAAQQSDRRRRRWRRGHIGRRRRLLLFEFETPPFQP